VDFDPIGSDVDFLVEYIPPIEPGLFDRHFGLVVALETLLDRHVHLVERAALRNPRIRAAMEADAQPLYAVSVPAP